MFYDDLSEKLTPNRAEATSPVNIEVL